MLAFFGISLVNWACVHTRLLLGLPVNVFWDYCDEAQTLAYSMCEKDSTSRIGRRSIVFALRREKVPWFLLKIDASVHTLMLEGWKWMHDAPGEAKHLRRAERHFFLSSNGHENVAGADALINVLKKYGTSHDRTVKIFVRVNSLAHDDAIFKWADVWNQDQSLNAEVILLREESVVSHNFLMKHPMLECPGITIDTTNASVQGQFNLLFIGFSSLGRTLLNDMICDGQFLDLNGHRLKMTINVIDKSESSYSEYETNCSDAISNYGISFENIDTQSKKFWDRIHRGLNQHDWNRIIICLDDDRENLAIARDIVRYSKWIDYPMKNCIFAKVRDRHINSYIKNANNQQNLDFTIFGNIEDTYHFDLLIQDKWEHGAMILNHGYRNNDKTVEENWKLTSTFKRESSFASFFHQRNLLRLLGYTINNNSNNENFDSTDILQHLDRLARLEHLRWMAWNFVQGIKTLPRPENDEDFIANQIDERNAHADLVDFDLLPNKEKKKDINIIACNAFKDSGIGIKKI